MFGSRKYIAFAVPYPIFMVAEQTAPAAGLGFARQVIRKGTGGPENVGPGKFARHPYFG